MILTTKTTTLIRLFSLSLIFVLNACATPTRYVAQPRIEAPAPSGTVFIGHATSMTLLPEWSDNVCDIRSWRPINIPIKKTKSSRMCVSNASGYQRIDIKPERVLFGGPVRRDISLLLGVGEWGPALNYLT
jgi:hypothetical protein